MARRPAGPKPPHGRAPASVMLALAGLLAGGAPALAQAPAHLLVGDVAAARLYVYAAGGDFPLLATLDDLAVGAHAGAVALPDGRVLIPDDRNKQLVVLRLGAGEPRVERRVPMPIPLPTRYAWAAADPEGRFFAATGLDSDESVKLLTLVDLGSYAAKQFRVDTGSPDAELNLAVGGGAEPAVFLHLAERVDSYRIADLMRAETKINALLDGSVKPVSSLPLARGGHSNSFSAATSHWTGSTLRGFEIARASGAALGEARTLPWAVEERAGGRNARQRLTADGRHVFGPISAPLPPPRWAEAEVDLHWVDLASGHVARTPLARGQVGRGGVSARFAAYASVHPDGDHLHLVDLDPASPGFRQAARVALPKLAAGPVAGEPAAGREGRHSAITPDGRLAFVSQGGEGRVHVVDAAARAVARVIETPTPLRGGGYLLAVQPGMAGVDRSAR